MRYMPVEIGETVEDIMLCIGCFHGLGFTGPYQIYFLGG